MRKIWEFIEGLSAVTIGMIVICGIPIIFWGLLPIWLSVTIFLITFGVYLFQEGRKYAEEKFKNEIMQPINIKDERDSLLPHVAELERAMDEKNNNDILNYVGKLKNGIKHGQGTLTYTNGKKYVGKFKLK